jgi:spore coat polysaccharide biosynthesis protein SpsF
MAKPAVSRLQPVQTTAIIVSRMGSSRFAGKALASVLGKPMFDFLVERVRRSRRIGRLGLATTDRPEDDRLAEHAIRLGMPVFRGSSEDVLGRLSASARAFKADPVIELLGDSPLVDGELIDDVVDFFHSGEYDYVATVTREYPLAPVELKRFPIGIRVQVMKAAALARCEKLAKEARNREHSTTFIYENPDLFRIGYFEAKGRWADLNRPDGFLAVNYPEDLRNVCAQVEWTVAKDPSCALRSLVW